MELAGVSMVVVAAGYRAEQELLSQLAGKYQVYSAGDCKEVRKMIDAIHEGFICGMRI